MCVSGWVTACVCMCVALGWGWGTVPCLPVAGAELDAFLELCSAHFDVALVPWVDPSDPRPESADDRALARLVAGATAMSKTRYAPLLYCLTRRL